MSKRLRSLTTTSYAVLGLLAVQPWSTYELTRQVDLGLSRFWPRARSKLYEEPKKLLAHGLAQATPDPTGRRPRTIYSITPAGRTALAEWTGRPGAGPVLEFEQLVQLNFAEHGSRQDALAIVAATRAWAVACNTDNLAAAHAYRAGAGAYPDRAAQNLLIGTFLTDFYALLARWADWATTQIEQWPDDPAEAVADPSQFTAMVERASWSDSGVGQTLGSGSSSRTS